MIVINILDVGFLGKLYVFCFSSVTKYDHQLRTLVTSQIYLKLNPSNFHPTKFWRAIKPRNQGDKSF